MSDYCQAEIILGSTYRYRVLRGYFSKEQRDTVAKADGKAQLIKLKDGYGLYLVGEIECSQGGKV